MQTTRTDDLDSFSGGTPVFHVWDFPDRIEVRLSDSFINRIRNMTVKKTVTYTTKPYIGHGWKAPRSVTKTAEINEKLIPHTSGHPYHKIAERLYPKTEWHGRDRDPTPHKPFISIKYFRAVHEVTKIPLEEMEYHIIAIRNHWAGHLDIPMTLPVIADEDWAWLFGFWFSSGGLITRERPGKDGYITTERSIRFSVDARVFQNKLVPILKRIAYVPKLGRVWYMKKGARHKLDKGRRKGVGGRPRRQFVLVRPVREIAEKFGLPKEYKGRPGQRGRRYGSRKSSPQIPEWCHNNRDRLHAFIEGYINGTTIASSFYPNEWGNLVRNVEIKFGGWKREEVEGRYNIVADYLLSIGITGTHHVIPHKTTNLYWCGYWIHDDISLRLLYEEFDIQRPDLRARLALNYELNHRLYQACKQLNSTGILLLGALIQEPMSREALYEEFRIERENIDKELEHLLQHKIAYSEDNYYHLNTDFNFKLFDRTFRKGKRHIYNPDRKRRNKPDDYNGQFRDLTPDEIAFLDKQSTEVK